MEKVCAINIYLDDLKKNVEEFLLSRLNPPIADQIKEFVSLGGAIITLKNYDPTKDYGIIITNEENLTAEYNKLKGLTISLLLIDECHYYF